jgi:lipoic acid synthetase
MVVERRLPPWMRVKATGGPGYLEVRARLHEADLHTVCEEAHCPNIGECWDRLSATFMILGNICTWRCHYCAVKTGRPDALDPEEPLRLGKTVQRLGLRYCVITSVTREDLADGGAAAFAECISRVRDLSPSCQVEVLIPWLNQRGLATVLEARPVVLNHNIETVRRIFHRVRPKGDYDKSLLLLRRAGELAPMIPVKSGIMVGLGETFGEIEETMWELRQAGCSLLTVGQYLRPSATHFPIAKFYHPDEFAAIRDEGMRLGFKHVASGPLVRSSYHAEEQASAVVTVNSR